MVSNNKLIAVAVGLWASAAIAANPTAGSSGGTVSGTKGSVPNQAQPAATPNGAVNTPNPGINPNPAVTNPNPNLANNGAVAGTNQNVSGTAIAADPNQFNNAALQTGSGLLNGLGGTGVLTGAMLTRLQSDSLNRKQVTLTGKIMDAQSFFLGGILGVMTPNIVGQPISSGNSNLNSGAVANGALQNATGAGAVPNVNNATTKQPTVTVPQSGVPNLAVQNQNQVVAAPQAGNVPNLAQPGSGTPGANNNTLASPVSNFGQLMVLQTNSGALLIAQDPLNGVSVPLSATAMPVVVQGRIYERAGMRLMLVSAVNVPGGPGTGNTPGTTINGSNNSLNNDARNRPGTRTNRPAR